MPGKCPNFGSFPADFEVFLGSSVRPGVGLIDLQGLILHGGRICGRNNGPHALSLSRLYNLCITALYTSEDSHRPTIGTTYDMFSGK